MGEVYRAADTNLKRQVAVKVLPQTVAADPERLARFQREAEVLAALNHPNIAQIFGLEKSAPSVESGATGFLALVMELVEGPTLADRIAQGPIALDEALPIAKQIAEALEAAHEQGIVHRDLKPANIKVRADGTVKVLDFGLAKAVEPASATRTNLSMSPTITTPALMTGMGLILGTAAYMSPEQARGKPVDRRTDIWAFGCVLYEMLTGRRAFEDEDVSLTLSKVLQREPDFDALPSGLPERIRQTIRLCLRKSPKERIPDIGAVRLALDGAFETTAIQVLASSPVAVVPPRPFWKRALPVLATALVVSTATAGVMWSLRPPKQPLEITRFSVPFPKDAVFTNTTRRYLAISPDGTRLVFAVSRRLYLRSMSEPVAKPITDQSPANQSSPGFSPDGRSVAYYEQADRTLKKISVGGGAAVTLCPAEDTLGLTWHGDSIFFATSAGMRVSERGGKPELVVKAKAGEQFSEPDVLPDGDHLVFTIATSTTQDRWDKGPIVSESLRSHDRKTLIDAGLSMGYGATGHLLYALQGVLFAVPFDAKRLATTGAPAPVLEGVRRGTGNVHASIASNGSLVYLAGPPSFTGSGLSLAFFDRNGAREVLKLPAGPYLLPRISPDGRRIAYESDDSKEAAIWVYELSGGSAPQRLTFEGQGNNRFPVWSADSQRVTFQSDREKDLGIYWQRADGAGTAVRLTKADAGAAHIPEAWSPDGTRLLYNAAGADSMAALQIFSMKDGKTERFDSVILPVGVLTGAVFSPDGKWVAYTSAEARSGAAVFVQPFPPTGAKYQISKNEDRGHHAMWSQDGKELFFTHAAGNVFDVVRVSTQTAFSFGEAAGVPRPFANSSPASERPYDITPDGQRFLGLINAADASGSSQIPQISVVLNWVEELKAKLPVK
jgi:serine/threonine-protein kinase